MYVVWLLDRGAKISNMDIRVRSLLDKTRRCNSTSVSSLSRLIMQIYSMYVLPILQVFNIEFKASLNFSNG